jgi:serine protease Do
MLSPPSAGPARESFYMHHKPILTAASLALCLACSNKASTQSGSAKPTETTPAPAAAAVKPVPAVAPTDFRRQFVEVAKTVRPAVVAVTSVSTVKQAQSPFEGSPFEFFFRGNPRPEGQRQRRQGIGSGVIVDARGYVLTNNHVVADADEIKVVFQDDRELTAEIVGTDPKTDIAVIKIKLDDKAKKEVLRTAVLGNSDQLEVGEWVMAVGSPFGLTQTVSAGIVSAVGRGNLRIAEYEDFIQTDAAVNPGNSGGPLVNLEGKVVGINTAIASQTGSYNGVGFAIPINMARGVMDQLIAHGGVTRGYLGVYITALNPELARSFSYTGDGGVLVQDVSPDGPAARAGLKPGDIMIERDGKAITDVDAFRNGIAQTPPGNTVSLTVFRGGKKQSLKIKLDRMPADAAVARKEGGRVEAASGRGLGLVDLSDEARRRFEIPTSVRGAVVARVDPDSPAAQDLRPGDVIAQVDETQVKNAAEAAQAISKAGANKPVRLRILREGRGMFVILPPAKK